MSKQLLVLFFLLGLQPILSNAVYAKDPESSPPKRRFTNEDLARYQDKNGTPEPSPSSGTASIPTASADSAPKAAPSGSPKGREAWAARLKEADASVVKAKAVEASHSQALSRFQERSRKATTDFDKQTAAWQVEDMEKNLARSTGARKLAEKQKATLLRQAEKEGLKESDLNQSAADQPASP